MAQATAAKLSLSPDKAFYDAEPIGDGEGHAAFVREITSYFATYAERLNADLAGTSGVVLELGAGSCTLSCNAARLSNVTRVVAADISGHRMERSLDSTAAIVGADRAAISTLPCDFNEPLPLDDQSVDAVLFDAALHHARNIWGLLAECRRVLRPGGVLVAQRESYLNGLRARGQLAWLLRTPEACAQVSENMYLRAQFEYYLRVNGFEPDFIPYSNSRAKRLLGFLNGWLFDDGTLYCRRA